MLHITKYGSEDLLGIKTKVSTVKGTKEVHPDHNTEPAKAPDEVKARPDKKGDDSEEEETKANEGGDTKSGQRSPDPQKR